MKIGIPREIKIGEGRVGLTPVSIKTLIKAGHNVFVETGAGILSGFSDDDYHEAGAHIVSQEEVWRHAEMIVKVKEPQVKEFKFFRKGLIVAAFFHFAAEHALKEECHQKGIVPFPYEEVRVDGQRPILASMSRIAGEIAADVAAHYLRQENGGRGILLRDAVVTTIGAAGVVGRRAYEILKPRAKKINALDIIEGLNDFGKDYKISNHQTIAAALRESDAVICAAGTKDGAVKLISREMVSFMKQGSVIIDVPIDEGGVSETSHPTTHANPTYIEEGVIHYCVANMPGAVPRSATEALNDALLDTILRIANQGAAALTQILSGH